MTYFLLSFVLGLFLFILTAFLWETFTRLLHFLKVKIKDETLDRIEIVINSKNHAESPQQTI